jgi:hypothetical protein
MLPYHNYNQMFVIKKIIVEMSELKTMLSLMIWMGGCVCVCARARVCVCVCVSTYANVQQSDLP